MLKAGVGEGLRRFEDLSLFVGFFCPYLLVDLVRCDAAAFGGKTPVASLRKGHGLERFALCSKRAPLQKPRA